MLAYFPIHTTFAIFVSKPLEVRFGLKIERFAERITNYSVRRWRCSVSERVIWYVKWKKPKKGVPEMTARLDILFGVFFLFFRKMLLTAIVVPFSVENSDEFRRFGTTSKATLSNAASIRCLENNPTVRNENVFDSSDIFRLERDCDYCRRKSPWSNRKSLWKK